MIFGFLVSWLVVRQGYAPAFLVAGVLHPLAFLVILATVTRVAPLHVPSHSAHSPGALSVA